jgi:hypothetical protein
MDRFEMVMVLPPESRMCESEDEAEHQDQNVRRDHVGEGPFVGIFGVIPGDQYSVHDVPDYGSNA